jgi:hypothetical protein
MLYAQMTCATGRNIGNEIQSIAAARHLPRIDTHVDQERLHLIDSKEPICVIMNAWFMITPCWPPAPALRPVFVGFHVTSKARAIVAEHAEYLRAFEPIGTRDEGTAEFLQGLGVRAEVTYCLTLSLPRREKPPADGRVFVVDCEEIALPKTLAKRAARITHGVALVSDATKLQYARELLDCYRDTASLVVTTRLHCALPCIAMGIPVIFFGDPGDYRTRIVADVGGVIYDRRLYAKRALYGAAGRMVQPIDWSPAPLDVEALKARQGEAVRQRLERLRP